MVVALVAGRLGGREAMPLQLLGWAHGVIASTVPRASVQRSELEAAEGNGSNTMLQGRVEAATAP